MNNLSEGLIVEASTLIKSSPSLGSGMGASYLR
jgi:hypothetical protein